MTVSICETSVRKFCNIYAIHSCRLLVAVSGGSDSVALFHLLHFHKKSLDIKEIGVIHVNHGLRVEESKKEEFFVKTLADDAKSPFFSKTLCGKKTGDLGIEEWARKKRYEFFRETQKKHNYDYIATGHTANDQAETVLMRLSRGSGVHGLVGIHPNRSDSVIRPLLMLDKKILLQWLKEHSHSWCEDESNSDLRFKRNWYRHTIIPAIEKEDSQAVIHLANFANHMKMQNEFLEPIINKWCTENVLEQGKDCFVIKKPDCFNNRYLFSAGLAKVFRKYVINFDKKHIDTFIQESEKTKGSYLLPGGWRYYPGKAGIEVVNNTQIKNDTLFFKPCLLIMDGVVDCENPAYRFSTHCYRIKQCAEEYDRSNWNVFLDIQETDRELIFRSIAKDDEFQPLGYEKSVNMISYIKKQKISKYYRGITGVVAKITGEAVWIPGVSIDHKYRISSATTSVLQISCQRIS